MSKRPEHRDWRQNWRSRPAITLLALLFAATLTLGQTAFLTIQTGDVEDVSRRLSQITAVRGVFIGVSEYATSAWPRLNNAAGDATALAAALTRRCGLADATVLTNQQATLPAIDAALRAIGTNCGADDLFVFHFSGHGQGLKEKDKRVFKGLLMLHNAPTLASLWRGDFRAGVIDLDVLDQMIGRAGIRAKHQLIILDSCYGGLGAYPRQVTVASPQFVDSGFDRHQLLRSATYVISAGGAEQTVFDGPPGGRGLLTGALISALAAEPVTRLVKIDDTRYLPMRDSFSRIAREIHRSAGAMTAAQKTNTPPPGNRSIENNSDLAQVPHDLVRRGEGHIYLPWHDLALGSSLPTNRVSASTGPSTRSAAATISDLELWSTNTALARGTTQYAATFRELCGLLREGPPTAVARPLDFAVETLVRIRSDLLRSLLGKPEGGTNDQDAAMDESLHETNPGANWTRLSESGGLVTTADELSLSIYSFSTEAQYYYVIGIDGRGQVRFLSDASSTNAQLAGRNSRMLPPSRRIFGGDGEREQLVRRGFRIDAAEAGVENAIIVIVSVKPWNELVDVVTRLGALTNNAIPAVGGLLSALPRTLGAIPETVLGSELGRETEWPAGIMPIAFKTSASWLGVSYGWRIAAGKASLKSSEPLLPR